LEDVRATIKGNISRHDWAGDVDYYRAARRWCRRHGRPELSMVEAVRAAATARLLALAGDEATRRWVTGVV
jgi:hypothetical protein